MKLDDYLKIYKPKIDEEIAIFFGKRINSIENDFLADYYTELKDYFLSGGKRIRPLLCIATYNAFSETYDETIVFPSISVEFLHNASLIHDDIIDKDDFRRGKPAFHYRFRKYHESYHLKKMDAYDFGTNIGILGGDTTFFLGFIPLLHNQFPAELNQKAINYYQSVFHELVNGVLIEVDMVNKKKLSIDEYIQMIALKTGALIEKSMLIGATYANIEDEKTLNLISKYALNLGLIFQIIDDILGTFGDASVTGKPTDGDIREGKKTCLLINALNTLETVDKSRLVSLIEQIKLTNDNVNEVKDLFIKAGVVRSAKNLAEKYYLEAKNAIDELKNSINESETDFFLDLLDFVRKRDF
ncbi:MAG: polyprenyl synthetase family protein [Promethearchaeota archaeon]